jgi:hypothetical protein
MLFFCICLKHLLLIKYSPKELSPAVFSRLVILFLGDTKDVHELSLLSNPATFLQFRSDGSLFQHYMLQQLDPERLEMVWVMLCCWPLSGSTPECCTFIRELGYAKPRFSPPSEHKVTTLRKEQVRTCNNAVRLRMLLSRGFRTDRAPAAYQQTTFSLTGHSQRANHSSAAIVFVKNATSPASST